MKKSSLLYITLLLGKCLSAQIDFLPYQATSVGSWPEVVSIADINNDGLNDVVLGTAYYSDPANDYKLFVFIQNSQGNLNPPVKYPYSVSYPGLRSMTIADVNNDNLNDVIIGYADNIGIFFQNSSGTLNAIQSFHSGATVDGTKCGDLNNDGLTDIAVSHWNDNFIRVFYQTLSGFTDTTYSKPSGGYDEIDVGDVNGDGLCDVVFMAGQGIGGIHVYTQNNLGTLNNYVSYFPPASSWTSLHGIAIGDLNNNGRNDIAASMGGNSPNANIVLWFQDTLTGLLQSPPTEISAYDIPEAIEIADLNCDNKNEIITAHGGWAKTSIYEQDSTESYNSYTKFNIPYATDYNPYGLAIGDINNDGKKDIAIADYNNGLVLLINDSKPTKFDTINIFTVEDTIYANTYVTHSNFVLSQSFENNGYHVTTIDSFMITSTFHEDSTRLDSITIRKAELCASTYSDTSSISNYYYDVYLLSADTTLLSRKRDSANLIRNINIFPNPTDEAVIIELPSPFDAKDLKINVYNDLGELILSKSYNENSNKRVLDLSEFAGGIYIVSITEGYSNMINKKIIKTR